jgi:hypothetical protein
MPAKDSVSRYLCTLASVAELADAQDLGSCPARGAGSTPAVRIQGVNRDVGDGGTSIAP